MCYVVTMTGDDGIPFGIYMKEHDAIRAGYEHDDLRKKGFIVKKIPLESACNALNHTDTFYSKPSEFAFSS